MLLTNMAVHLRFLLILIGLTGIYSITTVHKVSVKAGDTITIPCIYSAQYINHVKYLCKGYSWLFCSPVTKTNQHRKFQTSDDKNKQIFTVTIKDLTDEDTNYYWCVVEINGGPDNRVSFDLSVSRGTPSLYVDQQEVRRFIGNNMTIHFNSSKSGDIKWCRLGGPCVRGPSGSIDGTKVTINRMRSIFTVTMSGLMTESSGWYLCAQGDLQIPVHLTVTKKPSTTAVATTPLSTISATPVKITSVTENKTLTTVQCERHTFSADIKSCITFLSLLIFSVAVALLMWFKFKHKQTKAVAAPSITEAGEQPTYCNIQDIRNYSSQRSYTESDVDVIYSTVVTMKQLNVQRARANEDNVIYSTLA